MAEMIYKQQALDAINRCRDDYDLARQEQIDDCENAVRELPTVRERTGHWVEMGQNEDGTHNICCGACGKFKIKSRGHANSYYTKNKYKFCGGCGAKMEVEHGVC